MAEFLLLSLFRSIEATYLISSTGNFIVSKNLKKNPNNQASCNVCEIRRDLQKTGAFLLLPAMATVFTLTVTANQMGNLVIYPHAAKVLK